MRSVILLSLLLSIALAGCDMSSDKPKASLGEYVNEAENYLTNGEVEKAIRSYKKALTIVPNDCTTHYKLGDIYYEEWKKSYSTASKGYQFDVLMYPNKKQSKELTEELKKFGLKPEYKESALGEFRQTIKYCPTHWKARYRIAADQLKNKDYQAAIAEFNKVIALNPQYSNAYDLLGEAYMETGSFDLAVDNFQKAIQLDQTYAYGYVKLGKVYLKMNDGKRANEILTKLKYMNPSLYDELRLYIFSRKRS